MNIRRKTRLAARPLLSMFAIVVISLGGCGGTRDEQAIDAPQIRQASLSLLAGSTSASGSSDGTGTAARFSYLGSGAIDKAGNLYVADFGNHTIRKITPDGVVTTVAGTTGIFGAADGVGTAATFYFPSQVALDEAGNLYVTNVGDTQISVGPLLDTRNTALTKNLRKITPSGVVTTVAGGQLAQAVAVDAAGNIYVAISATIRKIAPGGVVTTLAGVENAQGNLDGTGATARIFAPTSMTADASGNIYFTDDGTVRKVNSLGVVTTIAGKAQEVGSVDGVGSAARFTGATGIAVDGAGNLYVADRSNFTIRKITQGGIVTTIAGKAGVQGVVLGALPGGLDNPNAVAIDPKSGQLDVLLPTAVLKIQ